MVLSCKHPVPFSLFMHRNSSVLPYKFCCCLLLFYFSWVCLFTVMFLDWWACLEVIQCFCFMKRSLLGTSVGKWDMMGYWTAVVSIKQLIFFLNLSNGLCWWCFRETKAYLRQPVCMFYVDIGHTEWELVFNAQSSMMIISIRLI